MNIAASNKLEAIKKRQVNKSENKNKNHLKLQT
jgi:hypothetical protein